MPRTLASVPAGVAIFVLDAESNDETVALARAGGAEVEVRPWTGFAAARNYALGRVATPYAFMLDADEVLDETLAAALSGPLGSRAGWRVHRVTRFAGRPVRTAGWSAERLVRVVRVAAARCVPASVGGAADLHERLEVDGEVGDLPGTLQHDSYPTVRSYLAKFARYTTIEAAALAPSPRALLREALRFVPRIVWSIARYGGWRDGWRGVFVALFSAAYPVVVRWRALRR